LPVNVATLQQADVVSDLRALNVVPAIIADLGDQAAWRYVEFFTANIRNAHTRRAYARACSRFFGWCEQRGLTLTAIRPHDVAIYIEQLQNEASAPSVKQQLAAVRMMFDWLVVGQIVPANPASAVRGPKHIVKTGTTPVLEAEQWRKLLDSIPMVTLRDLRDRALIATLTYSFARVTAALNAAGIAEDRKGWLFRTSSGHNGDALSDQAMDQSAAWRMIRRRAAAAGITAPIGNHTFRATGITAYLSNGGALEHAQEMAAHESPRTTKLYDRTRERLTQDEIERIRL
jgi:site-specific recombinase XerD